MGAETEISQVMGRAGQQDRASAPRRAPTMRNLAGVQEGGPRGAPATPLDQDWAPGAGQETGVGGGATSGEP